MYRKIISTLSLALAVTFTAATLALAAGTPGTVSAIDQGGMATVKLADGKEHKVTLQGAKVGDKVDCETKDGKVSCKSAMTR
jgi:hypothetical protein